MNRNIVSKLLFSIAALIASLFVGGIGALVVSTAGNYSFGAAVAAIFTFFITMGVVWILMLVLIWIPERRKR